MLRIAVRSGGKQVTVRAVVEKQQLPVTLFHCGCIGAVSAAGQYGQRREFAAPVAVEEFAAQIPSAGSIPAARGDQKPSPGALQHDPLQGEFHLVVFRPAAGRDREERRQKVRRRFIADDSAEGAVFPERERGFIAGRPQVEPVLPADAVGGFEMGIPFIFFGLAMRKTSNPALINQLCYLSPFMSLFFISVVLGEQIVFTTYIGLVMIVLGIVFNQYFVKSSNQAKIVQ